MRWPWARALKDRLVRRADVIDIQQGEPDQKVGDRAELWLEGDLAAILSFAAGRKILQSMSAGEAETLGQKRKKRPRWGRFFERF